MKKLMSAALHPVKRPTGGFTLVEILLFVSIAAFTLGSIAALYGAVLSARVKNQTISEVDQQAAQAMQRMEQAIRNSNGITSP